MAPFVGRHLSRRDDASVCFTRSVRGASVMDLPAFTKGQRLCERFVLLEPLHSSANGSIWRALDEQRSSQAAIKCVSRATEAADRLWLSLQRQYALRQRLEHDHLLALEEPVRDGEALVLPMQLAAGNASRLRGKSWKQWQGAAIEVARAFAAIADRSFASRKMSPDASIDESAVAERPATDCTMTLTRFSVLTPAPLRLTATLPAETAVEAIRISALMTCCESASRMMSSPASNSAPDNTA